MAGLLAFFGHMSGHSSDLARLFCRSQKCHLCEFWSGKHPDSVFEAYHCRAPTAGGQYHWVSEFAPERYQKPLSYFIGWMAALSWQAGQASGPFLVGTLIQGMISVNNPNYEPTNWQGTMLVWAVVVLIYILNVWGNDSMPFINNVLLVIHFTGFLAIVVTLWTLSPRNTADIVFTQFANEGGFSSIGLALMVGQLSAIYGLICELLVLV